MAAPTTTTHRQRASRPRAKTGCLICRQRRIKCDEAKPNCRRCIASGWSCQYAPPPVVASKQALARVDRGSASPSSSSSSSSGDDNPLENLVISEYVMPFSVPGDKLSRKALHHFCTETALDLSGNSYTDFWRTFVLQRCEHESVVRQAVVALSSIHLDYVVADHLSTNGALAAASKSTLVHYDKAVYKLRKYIDTAAASNVTRAVVLICCACFVSFELIRGNVETAFAHLQSGMGILRTWERERMRGQADDMDIKAIVGIFGLLDTQASLFDGERAPTLASSARPEPAFKAICERIPTLPDRFTDILHAQKGLRVVFNRTLGHLIFNDEHLYLPPPLIPPHVLLARNELYLLLDAWGSAMQRLAEDADLPPIYPTTPSQQQPPPHTPERKRQLAAQAEMYLQQLIMRILLTTSLADCPSRSAVYDTHGAEVLRLARLACTAPSNNRRRFSVDLGVLAPVFLLALKTSSPEIRHACLDLIEEAGLAEGFCNPKQMVHIISTLEQSQLDCAGVEAGCGCKDPHSLGRARGWSPLEVHAERMGQLLEGDTLGLGSLFAGKGFEQASSDGRAGEEGYCGSPPPSGGRPAYPFSRPQEAAERFKEVQMSLEEGLREVRERVVQGDGETGEGGSERGKGVGGERECVFGLRGIGVRLDEEGEMVVGY